MPYKILLQIGDERELDQWYIMTADRFVVDCLAVLRFNGLTREFPVLLYIHVSFGVPLYPTTPIYPQLARFVDYTSPHPAVARGKEKIPVKRGSTREDGRFVSTVTKTPGRISGRDECKGLAGVVNSSERERVRTAWYVPKFAWCWSLPYRDVPVARLWRALDEVERAFVRLEVVNGSEREDEELGESSAAYRAPPAPFHISSIAPVISSSRPLSVFPAPCGAICCIPCV